MKPHEENNMNGLWIIKNGTGRDGKTWVSIADDVTKIKSPGMVWQHMSKPDAVEYVKDQSRRSFEIRYGAPGSSWDDVEKSTPVECHEESTIDVDYIVGKIRKKIETLNDQYNVCLRHMSGDEATVVVFKNHVHEIRKLLEKGAVDVAVSECKSLHNNAVSRMLSLAMNVDNATHTRDIALVANFYSGMVSAIR